MRHTPPQAHVVCGYSHTLGDDAIMMYGMPNEAMLHDFFGNTHTDANSSRKPCARWKKPPAITKPTALPTGHLRCGCLTARS
jgi:hypothetical protein